MRVAVDYDKCIASGMCTSLAATLFKLDDEQRLQLLHDGVVLPDEEDSAVDAVECCPVEALSLLQGSPEPDRATG